jgi:uncharacterized membrane protein (UPF0136 family)
MTSRKLAASAAGLYGLIALTGGIIGFVKAGSLASLIAGGISGLLLIACAAFVSRKPKPALIVALVVSIGLLGRFLPKVSGPEGLSAIALVMALGGFLVAVACVVAVKQEPRAAEA